MMPNTSKLLKWRYIGTIKVLVGTSIVRITKANRMPLPGKLKRANPYPAKAQDAVVSSVVTTTNNSVLPNSGK
ncbi:hypothetical protein D3C79_962660 [compost metagenome]